MLRKTLLTSLAAIALTAGGGAATANATVNIAGVNAATALTLHGCQAVADFRPAAYERPGTVDVWAYAQVYDYAVGRWLSTPWTFANWTNVYSFYLHKPYPYAYITYARYASGAWRFAHEWVAIDASGVDNVCFPSGFSAGRHAKRLAAPAAKRALPPRR